MDPSEPSESIFVHRSQIASIGHIWIQPSTQTTRSATYIDMTLSKFKEQRQRRNYITAVSSDSRPPNPKCLTAIIVFDI